MFKVVDCEHVKEGGHFVVNITLLPFLGTPEL